MTNKEESLNPKSKLVDYPEEIDEKNGIKIYGETSYENQIAVLSHYLHNTGKRISKKLKVEIIDAIREFLSRKSLLQKSDIDDYSDENLWKVAEAPGQYSLFKEFLNLWGIITI